MLIRYHIIVTGRVQGVGFRYFTKGYADRYGLTGWVRNELNGSVQMEVQGSPNKLNLLCETIKEGNRFIRIDSFNKSIIATKPEDKSFNITY